MLYLVILSRVQVPKGVDVLTKLHPPEFTVQVFLGETSSLCWLTKGKKLCKGIPS